MTVLAAAQSDPQRDRTAHKPPADQNWIRTPSCKRREGAWPTRKFALPKPERFKLVLIPSKFGWLIRLNASKRSCNLTASVTLKFLSSDPSRPLNHGPWNRLRPNLPN